MCSYQYVRVIIPSRDNCGVKHFTDPECRLKDLPNLAIYHAKAPSHLCVCVPVCVNGNDTNTDKCGGSSLSTQLQGFSLYPTLVSSASF